MLLKVSPHHYTQLNIVSEEQQSALLIQGLPIHAFAWERCFINEPFTCIQETLVQIAFCLSKNCGPSECSI